MKRTIIVGQSLVDKYWKRCSVSFHHMIGCFCNQLRCYCRRAPSRDAKTSENIRYKNIKILVIKFGDFEGFLNVMHGLLPIPWKMLFFFLAKPPIILLILWSSLSIKRSEICDVLLFWKRLWVLGFIHF